MHKLLFGITIGAVLLGAAQKGDRAELQLQAAINKEVVEGDLKGAIEQYRKVAQSANRTTAAKALVRMGQCYERLGDAEARKAYERVVRDFADQKDMAAQAQTRLASLGGGEHRGPASVTMRRIGAGAEINSEGAVSPDGQWLSFTTADDDVAIYNLITGEKRVLKHNPRDGRSGGEEVIWSPDGKQIAYGWDYCGTDCVELRVMQADGSGDRLLYRNDKLSYVEPFDWSPDGKYISAALTGRDYKHQLVLVDARSGALRVLRDFPRDQFPQEALFSPDGRYLAYELPQQPGEPNRDIALISLDGSASLLVQNPAQDKMLAWTKEGVLFASDRTGTTDVWLQRVADGKPQGPPQRLKAGIGQQHWAMGLTGKGALYFSVDTGMRDILVAALDPVTGKVVSQPAAITQRHVGSTRSPSWSPEGKRLAYFSQEEGRHQAPIISIFDLAAADDRDLKTDFMRVGGVNWSPDGQLLVPAYRDKSRGIYRVNPQTGAATALWTADSGTNFSNPYLSRDGKTLYFTLVRPGYEAIVAFEPATGAQRAIIENANYAGAFRTFALSPDGAQIAFAANWQDSPRILVVPVTGGAPRPLLQLGFVNK